MFVSSYYDYLYVGVFSLMDLPDVVSN